MAESYKPGEKPKDSAQFIETGPRGGKIGKTEITGIEGKPLPPTSKPGNKWVPIDKTKHKMKHLRKGREVCSIPSHLSNHHTSFALSSRINSTTETLSYGAYFTFNMD